jgi:hypothetical protein
MDGEFSTTPCVNTVRIRREVLYKRKTATMAFVRIAVASALSLVLSVTHVGAYYLPDISPISFRQGEE